MTSTATDRAIQQLVDRQRAPAGDEGACLQWRPSLKCMAADVRLGEPWHDRTASEAAPGGSASWQLGRAQTGQRRPRHQVGGWVMGTSAGLARRAASAARVPPATDTHRLPAHSPQNRRQAQTHLHCRWTRLQGMMEMEGVQQGCGQGERWRRRIRWRRKLSRLPKAPRWPVRSKRRAQTTYRCPICLDCILLPTCGAHCSRILPRRQPHVSGTVQRRALSLAHDCNPETLNPHLVPPTTHQPAE